MSKRVFEILDEMNQDDMKNNTSNVGICTTMVRADKTKQGGHVTIGVPEGVILDLIFNEGKKKIVLLIIEKAEYDKKDT